ncbi:hypothetical protein Bca52824_046152 [Brassica carinata]|uniref:Uncharacterized protein n=1 Tax=Brassica carinata TaxID=52824 RepID=A0A8X7RGL9_BRACI|nr:hypothetical protein Bca52824_046152 [Brassica carinata]
MKEDVRGLRKMIMEQFELHKEWLERDMRSKIDENGRKRNEEMKSWVNEKVRMMNEEMQGKTNEKIKTMHMGGNGRLHNIVVVVVALGAMA